VLDFRSKNPTLSIPLLASYAILAWIVAENYEAPNQGRDPFYACRDCLTVRSFIHHLNDVRAELKRANKARHAYEVLRWYFLDSELEEVGLGQMVLDNVGRDFKRSNFWEHCDPEKFKRYYLDHGHPVPATT
jgi:hypothetical protein